MIRNFATLFALRSPLRFAAFALPVCMSIPGLVRAADEHPAPVLTTLAETVEGIPGVISLTGTVTPKRRSKLSSRAAGLVMEMRVDAGAMVKKGDTLMSLDTRLAEISLELIRTEIARGEIELEEAKRQEEEVRNLTRTGGISKSEAETRKSAVRISESTLAQMKVREQEQIEMIARHQLIAPFSGVISQKNAEEGEWVTTGAPVFELVEVEMPRFDLQVPQEFLSRISGVERITVILDAYPDKPIEAEIEVIVPVKDRISRTFLARLSLKDSENLAAPGMSGQTKISYRENTQKTVQIPRDAVIRFPDGTSKVWILSRAGENSTVTSRIVKTGNSLGEYTEIKEGLDGGEEIILKGNEGLREEMIVSPKPLTASSTQP
jgi:RND family efflux transporter MFP subunit